MKFLLRLAICALLHNGWVGSSAAEDAPGPVALGPLQESEVPDDAQLQEAGARIGHIYFQVDDIFDDAPSLAAPYKIANALHIDTQRQALEAQLLFKRGDRFERRVLDETERTLRQRRYLSDAEITPVRYHPDGTVDVLVHVRDVWTLMPGISFGRKGGANSSKLKIEETNVLGFGKEIALEQSSDVDRDTTRLRYRDANLWGSRWQLEAAYLQSSDGGEQSLQLGRPFYSLDTRWSLELDASKTAQTVSRYSLGQVSGQFDEQLTQLQLSGGISAGLDHGWAKRWLGGLRYERQRFSATPDEPSTTLPADRTLAYPWVGVELIEDDFRTARDLDQVNRTEDLFLGSSARFELGLAARAFGSSRDALVLNGALRSGGQWSDEQFLTSSLEFHGRIEDTGLRNGLIDFTSRYHLRQSPRRVLYGSFNASFSSDLDPEQQLLLGGDNGLRGFPLRYQTGTARAVFTLEERFHTQYQPFKLLNVGAAVFFDAGRVWGKEDGATEPLGWLADVGVGLRLGGARSGGLGNVLHLDLAYPLNGPREVNRLQFLIGTHRSF